MNQEEAEQWLGLPFLSRESQILYLEMVGGILPGQEDLGSQWPPHHLGAQDFLASRGLQEDLMFKKETERCENCPAICIRGHPAVV